MSTDLSDALESYVAGQRDRKLEEVDKKLVKSAGPDERQVLKQRRQDIITGYRTDRWLDSAVARASQIRISTHAPKFTHPNVRGGGIHAPPESEPRSTEIGTHTLGRVQADIEGNAAALDVGNLLLIGKGDDTLWLQVMNGDETSLARFSDDPGRVTGWVSGLARAIAPFSGRSHALAKQTYFPVDDGYHLISPQFASSLAHEMYERVEQARFSEEAKAARKQRAQRMPGPHDDVRYTSLARMKFGGSKPQNVSLLNSKRRGVVYLLDAAPPLWQSRLSLPVSGKAALWRLYGRRGYRTFETLQGFLERIGDHNNVEVRRHRQGLVAELVDHFLYLVAEIRTEGSPGWSRESDLPLHEQCLLDPERTGPGDADDESFVAMLESGDWRADVARAFGRYVNRRLEGSKHRRGARGKKLELGDTEADAWAKVMKAELSRLREDLELVS